MSDGSRRLLKLITVLGIGLAVVIILALPLTSRPSFCGTCHEMRRDYQAWQTSGHRGVECLSCHAEPGWTGLLRTKAKGLTEVYLHFRGNYQLPITISANNRAFSQRCLKCHTDRTSQAEGPHNEQHFASGVFCVTCHQGLVHDPAANRVPPGRDACRQCHAAAGPA